MKEDLISQFFPNLSQNIVISSLTRFLSSSPHLLPLTHTSCLIRYLLPSFMSYKIRTQNNILQSKRKCTLMNKETKIRSIATQCSIQITKGRPLWMLTKQNLSIPSDLFFFLFFPSHFCIRRYDRMFIKNTDTELLIWHSHRVDQTFRYSALATEYC